MDITLESLKNVCSDIKDNWDAPNDSHTKAEFYGMCVALDMIQKHYQELQNNDNLEIELSEQVERNEKLQEKYEQLAEQLVGDDATVRYTHEELINEVNRLKDIEENENE